MDLKQVAGEAKQDEQVAEHELMDRNFRAYSAGEAPVILVVGEYSRAYRKNEKELLDAMGADIRKGLRWSDEKYAASKIAAGVVGWKNITAGGKPVEYSLMGVVEWFVAAPWHGKQAERLIRNHADFFEQGSSS